MSSVPSRNMTTPAELRLAQLHGYIVLDHADRPDEARPLAEVAESYRASCAAKDRPYVTANLGPRKAEVVLDMAPCSWELCVVCLKRFRAVIVHYPDGPTREPDVGPGLIRVVGVSRLAAPFLAWELVGDAIDCRKRHGLATSDRSAPRMFALSRPMSPELRAEAVTPAPSSR